jgi:signal transduction histidine kinase
MASHLLWPSIYLFYVTTLLEYLNLLFLIISIKFIFLFIAIQQMQITELKTIELGMSINALSLTAQI